MTVCGLKNARPSSLVGSREKFALVHSNVRCRSGDRRIQYEAIFWSCNMLFARVVKPTNYYFGQGING